jgi:hypothetical protein
MTCCNGLCSQGRDCPVRYSPEDVQYRVSEAMRSSKLDPNFIEYIIVIFFFILMIALGYFK